jgi:iron(III) transport system substrate-binding protein
MSSSKNPVTRRTAGAALLATLCAGMASAAEKHARSLPEIASYLGADREAMLVDGAKREGQLTVYYAHPIVQALSEAFSRKYGIKVSAWRAGSEAIMQRVTAEYRAGKNDADVFLSTIMDTEGAARARMLQEIKSPYQQDLIAQALPAHLQWTAFNLDIYTAAYNPRLVDKGDLPKSYQDLLDPKWKGKLAVEANDQDWYGSVLRELGEEKGRKLFADIIARNGITVRKGHSLLSGLVASGEVPLALTVYSWNPEQLKRKGAPIEGFFIAPVFANASGIGVMNNAPHPCAAVLFYDFLFNEGPKLMADAGYVPTSKKVASSARDMTIRFVDPSVELAMQEKWVKLYDDDIVKKAR